ncbi:hypothetical protein PPERSA_01878 [Pseudocohnilembus persalinus]|uniref:FPL domain-containing protein n=1 Tax=Pseudocohnilembus persalinus TaxID=266149 RepID=A0A0V0R2C7_PSEPJ|nr:hypothetical protein PPERSA_01878 [Pseudocohnilembus persalinus]|eukprot:KRX08625.1 hypothetical protein PPERSA_01878 [Pseudocohnilembus persalinus]
MSSSLKYKKKVKGKPQLILENLDQNIENFDYVCEYQVLEKLFDTLYKTRITEIVTQVISSFGMIIFNLKKPQTLNFVLSNQSINKLVCFKHYDFSQDDVVDYYISFLKSLSQKLDQNYLQLFFNYKFSNFPLLWQNIKFYNYKDQLVRTSVQNIFLGILKQSQNKILNKKYLCQFPFVLYYINQSCYLLDQWKQIDDLVLEQNIQKKHILRQLIDDQIDAIFLIEDILDVKNQKVNTLYLNSLFNYAFFPGLIQAFTFSKKGAISLNISLHILTQIFENFQNKTILEYLLLILLGRRINTNLYSLIQNTYKPPISYSFQWSQYNFWENYSELLRQTTEANFNITHFDEQDENNSQKNKDQDFQNTFKIQDITKWDNGVCEGELKRMSQALGVELVPNLFDQNINIEQKTPIFLYQTIQKDINQQLEQDNENFDQYEQQAYESYQNNPFRQILMSFLKSKDDTLLLLFGKLLQSILKNKNISTQVLQYCGLLTHTKLPENSDFQNQKYNFQSINQIQYSLLEQLSVDPLYKINTLRLLANLLQEFCLPNDQNNNQQIKLFSQKHLNLFNNAFKLCNDNLQHLIKNQIVWEFLIELFEQELENNNQEKYQIKIPYNIFFFEEQEDQNLELELRQPINNKEITRRDLLYFFLIRNLRYFLIKKSLLKDHEQNIPDIYFQFIDNETQNWKINQQYKIGIYQLKAFCTYSIDGNESKNGLVIIDQQYFLLAQKVNTQQENDKSSSEQSQENSSQHIKIEDIQEQQQIQDNNINKNSEQKEIKQEEQLQDKYIDVDVLFENPQICQEMKKLLENNKSLCKKIEMSILVRSIELTNKDKITIFQ